MIVKMHPSFGSLLTAKLSFIKKFAYALILVFSLFVLDVNAQSADCYDASHHLPTIDCTVYAANAVCGCDDVTYYNICDAYFKNGISEYTVGACSGDISGTANPIPGISGDCANQSAVVATVDCSTFALEPVCGCNDVTYASICEAFWNHGIQTYTMGACANGGEIVGAGSGGNLSGSINGGSTGGSAGGSQTGGILITGPTNGSVNVPTGGSISNPIGGVGGTGGVGGNGGTGGTVGCVDSSQIDTSIDCSRTAYNPVCGCDGVTYDNVCEAFWGAGLTAYTVGPCAGDAGDTGETNPVVPVAPSTASCYNEAVIQPTVDCDRENFDPVCACDDVTYDNICSAYFGNGLTEYTIGACENRAFKSNQQIDLFSAKGVPTVICHEGTNKLGNEILFATSNSVKNGTVRFFNQTCFQFVPNSGFTGTEKVTIKWFDGNGVIEKENFNFKSNRENEFGITAKTQNLNVVYENSHTVRFELEEILSQSMEFSVYSVAGNRVYKGATNNRTWNYDISSLQTGMYIVQTERGSERFMVR